MPLLLTSHSSAGGPFKYAIILTPSKISKALKAPLSMGSKATLNTAGRNKKGIWSPQYLYHGAPGKKVIRPSGGNELFGKDRVPRNIFRSCPQKPNRFQNERQQSFSFQCLIIGQTGICLPRPIPRQHPCPRPPYYS